MFRNIIIILFLFIGLLKPIFASQNISSEYIEKITSTNIYNFMNNEELLLSQQKTLFFSGGLIDLIFNSLLLHEQSLRFNSEAEKNVTMENYKALKEKVKKINYKKKFNTKLEELIKSQLIKKKPLLISKIIHVIGKKEDIRPYIYKNNSDLFLLIETSYNFINKFRAVNVISDITIQTEPVWYKPPVFEDDEELEEYYPLLKYQVIFQSEILPDDINAIDYWIKENRLINTLLESIEIVPELIVLSIKNINKTIQGNEKKWRFLTNVVGQEYNITGYILDSTEKRDNVYITYHKISGHYGSFSRKVRVDLSRIKDVESDEF